MFLITQTLIPEKIHEGKGEELFKAHVAWFTRHFDEGDFILVGPYTDKKMAGIMISPAETKDAVEAVLKDDVYYAGDMAIYEVRSFTAGKIAKNFSSFEGK